MTIFLIGIVITSLIRIKPQRNKVNYLSRDVILCVSGIFALIFFCFNFVNSLPQDNFSSIDSPLVWLFEYTGPLLLSPIFFFGGFSFFEWHKNNDNVKNQHHRFNILLKLYLAFFVSWLLYVSVSLYFRFDYSVKTYLLSIFGIESVGNLNLIFLVLFLLLLVSVLSLKFCGKDKKVSAIIHIFAIPTLALIFNRIGILDAWLSCALFSYLFGVLFSLIKNKFDLILSKKRYVALIICFASLLTLFLVLFLNKYISLWAVKVFFSLLSSFCLCLFIVVFLFFFQVKNKILHFFGSYSFWVCMFCNLPIFISSKYKNFSNNIYVFFVISFISVIILSFLIGKAFSYSWNIIFEKKGNVGESTNIRVGIVISYIALAVSIVGSFVVTPILLENLGDSQYGLRSFATSITSWLTIVSSALTASYLRFVNQETKVGGVGEGKVNSVYLKVLSLISAIIIVLTIVGVGLCFIFNFHLSNYSDSENKIILTIILISGFNLAINIFVSIFSHYLTYRKEFIFIRGLALIVSLLTYALELVFVFLTKSVISLAIVAAALSLLSGLVSSFYALKIKKMNISKTSREENNRLIKAIVIFSSFILLNAIVDQINKEVDITILGIMRDATLVTDYTISRYFVSYMTALSVAISGTYAPKVHEYIKNNDKIGLNKLFLRVSKIQLIIMILIVGGFASCGKSFMLIWLGQDKLYYYYYMLVFLLLNIIPLSCNLCIEVQRALNKHKFRAILYIALALINVGISVLLIFLLPYNMAVWGAIAGTVFSVTIGNIIILNIYNQKVIGLNMLKYFLFVLKYLVVGAISFSGPYFLNTYLFGVINPGLNFVICGLLFTLTYFLILAVVDRRDFLPFAKKIISKIKNKSNEQ